MPVIREKAAYQKKILSQYEGAVAPPAPSPFESATVPTYSESFFETIDLRHHI